MPLYEYRCRECAHLEEVLQKVNDPAPATCPSCGKEHTLEKEVSLTSFQLKGGGWYKDLYSSAPKDGDKKKADASASSKASESKPDNKPAGGGGDKKSGGGGDKKAA